jgi:hypothetical protein
MCQMFKFKKKIKFCPEKCSCAMFIVALCHMLFTTAILDLTSMVHRRRILVIPCTDYLELSCSGNEKQKCI